MPSPFRSCLATVVAIIVTTITATYSAKADTYKLTVVDTSQSENFGGIDDNGNFFINDNGNNAVKCGELPGSPCYEVFLIGQSPFFTTTAPVLTVDNGAPCTVAVSPALGQSSANGICNNGHEILNIITPILGVRGVYDGPNLSDVISNGLSFDGGLINANGDAVFISGINNELIFAQDLTTTVPEPISLYLLGTGCLGMLGTLHRKIRAR